MVQCRECGRPDVVQVPSCLACGYLTSSDNSIVELVNSQPPPQWDVVFVVQGSRFPAIRELVCAASPVFHAMLSNGMRETDEDEIETQSVDKASWTLAVSFIHTGQVQVKSKGLLAGYYFSRINIRYPLYCILLSPISTTTFREFVRTVFSNVFLSISLRGFLETKT